MTEAKTIGASTLADFPDEIVLVSCDRCQRRAQYRKSTLLMLFGPNATLSDVLTDLAHCIRAGDASAPCGAHFPDLAEK